MIKILELIDTGFIGGGQIHILLLSKYINKNHFEVLIASTPKGPFKTLVEKEGFKFFDVHLRKSFNICALRHLESIVNIEKIEILHSHGTVAGVYAKILKKRNPFLKLIHSIHGYHYLYSSNFLKRNGIRLIERILVDIPDMCVLPTNYDISLGLENKVIMPDRVSIIPYGIELENYSSEEDSDSAVARELRIRNNGFVIGNISRFDVQKNQKLLIEILPAIIKDIPGVQLLLIGEGELMEDCRKLVVKMGLSEKVIFAGVRTDLKKIFPLIDIFVFPSKWEGLSLTLIEAMAARRCILASDIPSNRELINQGQNGFLFELNNKIDLINKIVELYKNPKLRELLASNAKASAKRFDVKQMVSQIEKLYLSILRK